MNIRTVIFSCYRTIGLSNIRLANSRNYGIRLKSIGSRPQSIGLSDIGLSDVGLSDIGLSDIGLSDIRLSDIGLTKNYHDLFMKYLYSSRGSSVASSLKKNQLHRASPRNQSLH
jgi:hypothetical protein